MKTTYLAALLCAASTLLTAQERADFDGKWDLTIKTPDATYPSWMQVDGNAVRVVGRVASVHPVKNVKIEGSQLTFHSQESFGKQIPVKWEFHMDGIKLQGKQMRSDGVTGEIIGVRAPPLTRDMPKSWSQPKPIFNGKDLTGWIADQPSKNHWKVEEGVLINESAGANIRTSEKFNDFKLHIEYNCPDEGNSGIYLRGRYETQVEYEKADDNDNLHGMGSIYGFLGPRTKVPPRPGEWESFDITLVGRTVTVVRDGVTIIQNKIIPGITGGALDSHEGEPGPLYIQGDHTGGMKYRNITISLPGE